MTDRLVSRALALAACALAVPVGFSLANRGSDASRIELLADGAVQVSDSRNGAAILSASNLAPGEEVAGTVTVANSGETPGALELDQIDLADAPGPGGAPLSTALQLTVEDVTDGSQLAPLYAGSFGGVGSLPLLTLPPGDSRTYRFAARLPDGGVPEDPAGGDNAVQGARLTTGFEWTLTSDDDVACGNTFAGSGADDRLLGTEAGDRISGGAGADRIDLRAGDDCATGGPGVDRIQGRDGEDEIWGELGRDVLAGGAGNDRIHARGGGSDLVRCGAGADVARVGPKDRVSGC